VGVQVIDNGKDQVSDGTRLRVISGVPAGGK
jgi:hypothetical protein